MTGELATSVMSGLLWWAMLAAAYTMMVLAIDELWAHWQRRQRAKRNLLQIEQEASASVRRISAAFYVAQLLIRQRTVQSLDELP